MAIIYNIKLNYFSERSNGSQIRFLYYYELSEPEQHEYMLRHSEHSYKLKWVQMCGAMEKHPLLP